MLDSVKISRRQSEIRQALAGLVGKDKPTDDETRQMDEFDREYRSNETRYRAALIAEDDERREAKGELETRSDREWSEIMAGFEMRQVALALDEGRQMDGRTAEIVSELRSHGGYRGVPVPWEALEIRAGETVSTATPAPLRTAPIMERLFASSVAARMGGQMVNIGVGEIEYPVSTSQVTTGWAASEGGSVGSPTAYETTDRPMKPDHTLGVQMKITRKALKQSGAGLEQAVRRDMNGAIEEALDKAVFLGSGASGEPTGIFAGAAAWGIVSTAVGDVATWATIREEVKEFMLGNAANSTSAVRAMFRPEVWNTMDDSIWDAGSGITEWDRMESKLAAAVLTNNALAAPTGSPAASSAVLTTSAGGVPPFFVGTWGAVDLIRDPYADAAQGGLRLTALATMDVTVSRAVQTRILTGIQ
ncbi:phage major capsid protein [Rhodobacteraceae bacterium DSL-40]|uniref:phage major capsid protein n=1 Tax=Amaricoccus sp. B4 TaxID=3368557 RepID=UPI000DAE150B